MKKDNIMDVLIEIYGKAFKWAAYNNQTIGENNDYYLTLEQLMALFKEYENHTPPSK